MLVGLGAVDDPASQSAETRGRLVDVPGGCAPPPGLPDPCEWAAVLALAVAEVVTGQRSPSQLGRWLDDAVMTELRFAARRHRHPEARPRTVATTSVASVRVQCPAERAVEATAHLRLGRRSAAIAFRLEVFGERWLCTALELGPRPTRSAAPRSDPASAGCRDRERRGAASARRLRCASRCRSAYVRRGRRSPCPCRPSTTSPTRDPLTSALPSGRFFTDMITTLSVVARAGVRRHRSVPFQRTTYRPPESSKENRSPPTRPAASPSLSALLPARHRSGEGPADRDGARDLGRRRRPLQVDEHVVRCHSAGIAGGALQRHDRRTGRCCAAPCGWRRSRPARAGRTSAAARRRCSGRSARVRPASGSRCGRPRPAG